MKPVKYDGEFYPIDAAIMAPVLGPIDVPIVLGAFNEGMLQVAGRVADGIIGHGLFTDRWWNETIDPNLAAGAANAGRDPAGLRRWGWVITSVDDDDPARAERDARLMIALLRHRQDLRLADVAARLGRRRRRSPQRLPHQRHRRHGGRRPAGHARLDRHLRHHGRRSRPHRRSRAAPATPLPLPAFVHGLAQTGRTAYDEAIVELLKGFHLMTDTTDADLRRPHRRELRALADPDRRAAACPTCPTTSRCPSDGLRHFAYGYGDDNPLYCDDDYATGTRWGGLIAPPTFLYTMGEDASPRPVPPENKALLKGDPFAGLGSYQAVMEFEWWRPLATRRRLEVPAGAGRRGSTRERVRRPYRARHPRLHLRQPARRTPCHPPRHVDQRRAPHVEGTQEGTRRARAVHRRTARRDRCGLRGRDAARRASRASSKTSRSATSSTPRSRVR